MLWRPDGGLKTKPIENRIVQEAGPGKGPASFLFRRALAAGVVDGVVGAVFPGEDQLADGHDVVALLKGYSRMPGRASGVWRAALWKRTMDPGPTLEVTRSVMVGAS